MANIQTTLSKYFKPCLFVMITFSFHTVSSQNTSELTLKNNPDYLSINYPVNKYISSSVSDSGNSIRIGLNINYSKYNASKNYGMQYTLSGYIHEFRPSCKCLNPGDILVRLDFSSSIGVKYPLFWNSKIFFSPVAGINFRYAEENFHVRYFGGFERVTDNYVVFDSGFYLGFHFKQVIYKKLFLNLEGRAAYHPLRFKIDYPEYSFSDGASRTILSGNFGIGYWF